MLDNQEEVDCELNEFRHQARLYLLAKTKVEQLGCRYAMEMAAASLGILGVEDNRINETFRQVKAEVLK